MSLSRRRGEQSRTTTVRLAELFLHVFGSRVRFGKNWSKGRGVGLGSFFDNADILALLSNERR